MIWMRIVSNVRSVLCFVVMTCVLTVAIYTPPKVHAEESTESGWSSILLSALEEFLEWMNEMALSYRMVADPSIELNHTIQVSSQEVAYTVVKVIDGDTIEVIMDGKVEQVRLIGVDTPEIESTYTHAECFGDRASWYTQQNLLGEQVYLRADATQDDRGIYGRLLRYVILQDGTNFNYTLIRQGFAEEYTYLTQYQYQQKFRKGQEIAIKQSLGLWDECGATR